MMNTKKIIMLVVLSLSLATVVLGTTGLSLISPSLLVEITDTDTMVRNAKRMTTTTAMKPIRLRKYK